MKKTTYSLTNKLPHLTFDDIVSITYARVEKCLQINGSYNQRRARIGDWLERARVMIDVQARYEITRNPGQEESILRQRLEYLQKVQAEFDIQGNRIVFDNRPPQWAKGY